MEKHLLQNWTLQSASFQTFIQRMDSTFKEWAGALAVFPKGWEDRLLRVRNENTSNATGLCLDPYDLCAAKLIAGREKHYAFVLALVQETLIDAKELTNRMKLVDSAEPRRAGALVWLRSLTN